MDINLALEKIGMTGNYASDCSSYQAMVATWRDVSVAIPTATSLQAASDTATGEYDWKDSMQETDASMPRWFEDYVTENSVTLADGKAKDSYDAKVLLRSEKP